MSKRERIFNMTKGKCIYCGCDLNIDTFHMEHLQPKAKGGKDKNNTFPSCPDCNLSKWSLSVEEFREKIERMATNTHIGRMISKYYPADYKQSVEFWFESADREEEGYGDLQKNIYDILDRQ